MHCSVSTSPRAHQAEVSAEVTFMSTATYDAKGRPQEPMIMAIGGAAEVLAEAEWTASMAVTIGMETAMRVHRGPHCIDATGAHTSPYLSTPGGGDSSPSPHSHP